MVSRLMVGRWDRHACAAAGGVWSEACRGSVPQGGVERVEVVGIVGFNYEAVILPLLSLVA